MSQFIDNVDWSKSDRMNAAAFRGFQMSDFVANELKSYIREHTDVEYEFGMCPRGKGQDDTNRWADLMTAVGWKFLKVENFGAKNLKDFQENMPLRFHPTVDPDGRLRFRNSWIMYMRKDVRDAQLASQSEAAFASLNEMKKGFEAPDADGGLTSKGFPSETVNAFGDSEFEIRKAKDGGFTPLVKK
jgi:hypothetical protein